MFPAMDTFISYHPALLDRSLSHPSCQHPSLPQKLCSTWSEARTAIVDRLRKNHSKRCTNPQRASVLQEIEKVNSLAVRVDSCSFKAPLLLRCASKRVQSCRYVVSIDVCLQYKWHLALKCIFLGSSRSVCEDGFECKVLL